MKQDRQGFALVTVLGILAVLVIITLGFGHRTLLERRMAAYAIDHTQALHHARGAAMRGIVELRNKTTIDVMRGQYGRTSFDQRWNEPIDTAALLTGVHEVELPYTYWSVSALEGTAVPLLLAPDGRLESLRAVPSSPASRWSRARPTRRAGRAPRSGPARPRDRPLRWASPAPRSPACGRVPRGAGS